MLLHALTGAGTSNPFLMSGETEGNVERQPECLRRAFAVHACPHGTNVAERHDRCSIVFYAIRHVLLVI